MGARTWLCGLAIAVSGAAGAVPSRAQEMYQPIPLPPGNPEIEDTLTTADIPTGEGGFARDYRLDLEADERISIEVTSEEFDTVVLLIADDGTTVARNDDGPDGTTNSLLFARIVEGGRYVVRVRAFGDTGGGEFALKLTRLQPVE